MRKGIKQHVKTKYKTSESGVYLEPRGTQKDNPFNTDLFILDIADDYQLKYDPYREYFLWTLLRKGGGRVLDGDFMDVVIYLYEKEILGWKNGTHCQHCGRVLVGEDKVCIKCDYI